jgi:succinate dehydrogenase / fumarate reductase cytochrome b subunit
MAGRTAHILFLGDHMAKSANRPLSPHLTGGGGLLHYVWGPHMLVSILHRATGDGMAIVGMPIMLWWLYSIAAGAEAYEFFLGIMTSIPGYVVLIGMSFALFEHMLTGLRHFVMDAGAGYELQQNRLWSAIIPIIALTLTVALWLFIFAKGL